MRKIVVFVLLAVGSFSAVVDSMKILPVDGIYAPVFIPQETPDDQFKRADANGDGKLDRCEFPNRDIWVAQSNDQQFKDFDTNADGFVSKDEQDAYLKKQEDEARQAQLDFYNSTIQEFDTNGDGLLQQDELSALLKTRYSLATGDNFGDIFAKFDTNGDKGIDISELENFENNLPWDEFDPIQQTFEPAVIYSAAVADNTVADNTAADNTVANAVRPRPLILTNRIKNHKKNKQ